MIVAVNPYHLTTREAPAMASALLARRVVTLLPAPGGRTGAEGIPSYVEFTRSWQWSLPLWRAGVLSADLGGDGPAGDMLAVHDTIRREDEYGCLRAFLQDDVCDDERAYLSRLAADLLRAGPHPGFAIPVAAAVDRFAGRHRVLVARPVATSLAQRAEEPLCSPVFTVMVPLLVQADAERILHARAVMDDALQPLRDSMEDLGACDDPSAGVAEVKAAASEYAALFERRRAEVLDGHEDDDVRVIDTPVTISGVLHGVDVVLRSSARAAGSVARPRDARGAALTSPHAGGRVLSLVIKPLGARR